MDLKWEKLLTLALILPVFFMISDNIMNSVTAIHVKSNGGFINTIMACAVTVLCSINICNTWLKVLIIVASETDNVKKVVVIHKILKEEESKENDGQESVGKEEEGKEEDTETKVPSEPAQQSATTGNNA